MLLHLQYSIFILLVNPFEHDKLMFSRYNLMADVDSVQMLYSSALFISSYAISPVLYKQQQAGYCSRIAASFCNCYLWTIVLISPDETRRIIFIKLQFKNCIHWMRIRCASSCAAVVMQRGACVTV